MNKKLCNLIFLFSIISLISLGIVLITLSVRIENDTLQLISAFVGIADVITGWLLVIIMMNTLKESNWLKKFQKTIWYRALLHRPLFYTDKSPFHKELIRLRRLSTFYKILIFGLYAGLTFSYSALFVLFLPFFQALLKYDVNLYILLVGGVLGSAFSILLFSIIDERDSALSRLYNSFRLLRHHFFIVFILEVCYQIFKFIK